VQSGDEMLQHFHAACRTLADADAPCVERVDVIIALHSCSVLHSYESNSKKNEPDSKKMSRSSNVKIVNPPRPAVKKIC